MSRLLSCGLAFTATVAVLVLARAGGAAGTAAGSGIYSFSVDGSSPPVLLTGTDGLNAFPAVSPDGSRVAFVSDRAHRPYPPASCDCSDDVYVMNLDGTGLRRVTQPTADWRSQLRNLVWSPDGSAIFFTAYFRAWPDPRASFNTVWSVSATGGVPHVINDYGATFALSADGRYAAVTRGSFPAAAGVAGELWIVNVRTDTVAVAGTTRAAPAWSPASNLVA